MLATANKLCQNDSMHTCSTPVLLRCLHMPGMRHVSWSVAELNLCNHSTSSPIDWGGVLCTKSCAHCIHIYLTYMHVNKETCVLRN